MSEQGARVVGAGPGVLGRDVMAPSTIGRPNELPVIPVLETGVDFPMATLLADELRAQALFDHALGHVPRGVLRLLDLISRRWLVRSHNTQLAEIDAIARRIGRPGTMFLSVNYEWGCTVWVGPSPDGASARLVRTLDWATDGLGRYVMAVKVAAPAGPFVTLTWPGFAGVIQGMAAGRFCGALNQAPMRRLGGGIYGFDWAVNRARVWGMPHPMPGQLLRTAFESARNFAEAKHLLTTAPIAAPAIFTLAGVRPRDTCTIERMETAAHVSDGVSCAANHWQAPAWEGRARGHDSPGRSATLREQAPFACDMAFPWLVPPVLNPLTRLAMVADAATGRLVAQGYEAGQPATQALALNL